MDHKCTSLSLDTLFSLSVGYICTGLNGSGSVSCDVTIISITLVSQLEPCSFYLVEI